MEKTRELGGGQGLRCITGSFNQGGARNNEKRKRGKKGNLRKKIPKGKLKSIRKGGTPYKKHVQNKKKSQGGGN